MTSAQDTANPFEAWQEMFRKSTEMWQQAAASGSPNPHPDERQWCLPERWLTDRPLVLRQAQDERTTRNRCNR